MSRYVQLLVSKPQEKIENIYAEHMGTSTKPQTSEFVGSFVVEEQLHK